MVELAPLMKGGRDMRKIFKYIIDDDKYIITNESGKTMLNIQKNNLILNGNDFYDALFKDYIKGDEIEIIKEDKDIEDKLYHAIYNVLINLINNIKSKIDEID